MLHSKVLFLVIAIALGATGCATPAGKYLSNRGADLADVFALEGTAGLNAHGLIHVTDLARVALGVVVREGAYGGVASLRFGVPRQFTEDNGQLPKAVREEEARERGGKQGVGRRGERAGETDGGAESVRRPKAAVSIPALSILPGLFRGEPVREYPLSEVPQPWIRFFDLDVSASLGVGAHVGFSPGELADFFAGWFGVDLAKDDGRAGAHGRTRIGADARDPKTARVAGAGRETQ